MKNNYFKFSLIQWLIIGAIFCLIFDYIPKVLQLKTISNGFADKFTWYFLFILMIVWIYDRCLGYYIIEKKDYLYI